LPCDNYLIDISAIKKDIDKIKDKSIQDQIRKKIVRVKDNPYIGEEKKYSLKNYRVVKVKNQRIVMIYRINEIDCIIIFTMIASHDKAYLNTFIQ
jgi:mRNA-degrading endonuclease RelE of RelBE toxin-antitoxin system